jgi:hypothetical protein
MKVEGLTNEYLDTFLLPLTKYFGGVYPCDKLPLFSPSEKFSLIINLSKENEKGSHYISISHENKKMLYFDSFGLPCYNSFILVYMHRYCSYYTYNTKTIQHVTSFFCGYFCAYFCLLQDKSFNFDCFLNLFSRDCRKNDAIIEKLIKEYISS